MDHTNKKDKQAFTITGDWAKQSAQLKRRFSQLTDADLEFKAGHEEDLLARLQGRFGKGRDEVIEILKGGSLRTAVIV